MILHGKRGAAGGRGGFSPQTQGLINTEQETENTHQLDHSNAGPSPMQLPQCPKPGFYVYDH